MDRHATNLFAISRGRARSRHSGFTLMELILVLVLLVVITTMGGMNLRGSLRHQSLQRAAEQVQAEWARARVKAIKTGRVQVFHHAVSGREFYTRGEASLDDPQPTLGGGFAGGSMGSSGAMTSGMPGGSSFGTNSNGFGAGSAYVNIPVDQAKVRELPRYVTFVGADVSIDQRTAIQLTGLAKMAEESAFGASVTPDPAQESTKSWGMPVYFFPDGTTSNAVLLLRNDRGFAVVVELRGLTGTSRVGKIQSEAGWDLSGVQP